MTIKVVFFGSPEFAIPSLKAICTEYDVVGVVTQPDRPAGRGKELTSPPIKKIAEELGIPTLQPNRLKDPGVLEQLTEWKADVFVVAAFGQIFRKNILDIPKFGLINVHASLLPRWRGASPIQAAILAGDEKTGVSIMKIDAGIDTGDVFAQQTVEIDEQVTAGELSEKLALIGAQLLMETLPDYLAGKNLGRHQDEGSATYAGMINKEDAILNIEESAEMIVRRVRAYQPWPIAKLDIAGKRLLIHKAHQVSSIQREPGIEFIHQNYPAIATSDGLLVLDQIQLAGKKVVDGRAFLQGNRDWGIAISSD